MYKLILFSLGLLFSANSALAHQLKCGEGKYLLNYSVKANEEVQIDQVKIQNQEKFVADVTEAEEGELIITLIDLEGAGATFLKLPKSDLVKVESEKEIQMAVEIMGAPGTDIKTESSNCKVSLK